MTRNSCDVVLSGAALLEVPAGSELRAADWLHRPARLGRMDRLCGLALLAADAALKQAQIQPATWDGERVGVVLGTAHGCHATNEEYYRGLLAEGARGVSPRLFAYTLPSSPVGEVTIHYGARGPARTLASGCTAGLSALGSAWRLCSTGRCDRVIVIAADVASETLAKLGIRGRDAAAALMVERSDALEERGGKRLAQVAAYGEAFAGGAPEDAAARALQHAQAMMEDAPVEAATLALAPFDDAVAPLEAIAAWLGNANTQNQWIKSVSRDPAGAASVVFLKRN